METNYLEKDKILEIKFNEDIDHHYSDKIRRKVDCEIERCVPKKIIFDFGKVSFMDSAGIGMILGRYKLSRILGSEIELINVNKTVKRILDISGITRIIKLIDKEEKAS